FFFQAEDGIRDGHVTGVQTCALPIFGIAPTAGVLPLVGAIPIIFGANIGTAVTALIAAVGQNAEARRVAAAHAAFKVIGVALFRSEERRVGKECRSQGSQNQLKKKG